MPCIYLTLQRKSKIEGGNRGCFWTNLHFWRGSEDQLLQESIFSFENMRFRSGASTRSLVSSYDSVREHQPEVSYLPTIPFESINPESRTFLWFRSRASTRSLVSSYDSVREHQPGVSYFPAIPFGSINSESCIFLTIPFEKRDNL